MLWLKACKRCHGDLEPQSDLYGSYLSCIQCGAEFSEREIRGGSSSEQRNVRASSPTARPAGRPLAA
jgi:hypothetical protein